MSIIVICGQVSTLLYLKNKFVGSFCLIEFVFFPFCIQKIGSCHPTLPFAKIVGPKVRKRETSIMLVSKVTIVVEAWVFCSLTRHARLFVPINLATNFNMKKRSNAATISKKGVLYLYQPSSEIRPLAVAGVECH